MLAALIDDNPHADLFAKVRQTCAELNVKAYVVGGYVRDLLLQRPSKDIDFVVVGNGIGFAQALAEKYEEKHLTHFKSFGTSQLKLPQENLEVELVGARKESYRRDSRKPIVEDGTLEEDLSRRDFTINALAISMAEEDFGELIDLFGGVKDLQQRSIKTPLEPDTTFSDDPLRMMRGIRFASQLQFDLHPEAAASIQRQAERIKIISQERITEELNKIMQSPKPSIGFIQLFDLGLLHYVFPEMVALHGVEERNGVGHKDNFYHTLQVVDNLAMNTRKLWLRWAALLHDIGKPASKRFEPRHGWTFHGHEVIGAKMVPRIFRRLRLPMNEKMKYVQKLVHLHLRPIALVKEVSDSALRRMIVDAGEDLEDLFMLCRADVTSKNERKVERILQGFTLVQDKLAEVEARDELRNWKPPITGEMIMEYFGLKPGRQVGQLKNAVKEAILNSQIDNTEADAMEFLKKLGKEMGLEPQQQADGE